MTSKPLERTPRRTVRLRYGRKTLSHGLRLGWRTEYPERFPVVVSYLPAAATENTRRQRAQ